MHASERCSGLSVLVVDDSDIIRKRLLLFLSSIPEVTVVGEAVDVPEALQLYQAYKPRVIILDLSLPGGNGTEVLAWIRRRSEQAVVIVFSSSPADLAEPRCRCLGANYYFNKQNDFEAAIKVIANLAKDHAEKSRKSISPPPRRRTPPTCHSSN